MTRTPLHMFGLKFRAEKFKDLVASGEHDVDAQDADGKTPLHYAAEQGNAPAVMCSTRARIPTSKRHDGVTRR